MSALTDDQLRRLYQWVDEVPLSRPKRNIARDFADAVLVAEIVSHYFPRLVELHNYPAANSTQQKMYNWSTLNSKVLRKFGLNLFKDDIEAVIQCRPGAIEKVLNTLQMKMAKYKNRRASSPGSRSGTPTRAASPSLRGRGTPGSRSASPARGGGGVDAARILTGPLAGAAHSAIPSDAGRPARGPVAAASVRQQSLQREVDQEILLEKEQTIQELKETVEILELKIAKLEQLVRLKDSKISKLQEAISRPSE